jgi:Domain of Unknown Function (DUF748)
MTVSPRALRIAAWTAVVLMSLMLAVWFTGPYVVSRIGQDSLTQLLGRSVTFGSVRIEPWDLALTIEDLRVARAGQPAPPNVSAVAPQSAAASATAPQLEVKRLRVDLDARSVMRLAPIVEGTQIEGPHLRFARTGAGRYDFEDIVQRLSAQPPEGESANDEPQRFALFNLKLRGGQVSIDDQPAQRKHEIQDLVIDLPFLSNLPADVEVKVQPRVAFSVEGTRVDSGAESRPFTRQRDSTLNFKVDDIDLAEWTAYWPAALPLRPRAGHVALDMSMRFALADDNTPRLSVHGGAGMRDLALTDRSGEPVLDWRSLDIRLGDVRPLDRVMTFESLQLDAPLLRVSRNLRGELNLARLAAAPAAASSTTAAPAAASSTTAAPAAASSSTAAPPNAAPAAAPPASAASAPPPPTAAPAWRIEVARVGLAEGRVQWSDAGTRPATALELQQVKLEATTLSWPLRHTIPFEAHTQLMAGERAMGELLLRGEASEQRVRVQAEAKQVDLSAGEPYLAPLLRRRLEGRFDLNAEWALDEPFGSARQALKLASLVVNDLRLTPKGVTSRKALAAQDVAAMKRLELADAQISLERRRISLARLSVQQPTLELARDATGRFNAMDWIAQTEKKPAASAAASASASAPAPASGPGSSPAPAPADGSDEPPAWAVSLDRLQIDGGRLRWRDAAQPATQAEPVHLALDTLKLDARRITWPLAAEASKVVFSTRLRQIGETDEPTAASENARDRRQPARIEWAGDVAMRPVAARGRLTVERLPVHALTAYGGRNIPVDLRRADAGFKGGVDMKMLPAGLQMRVDGDARLTDVQVFARAANAAGAGDELVNWQSFDVPALKLQLAPGAKPSVELGEATLTDFYAKLLITEQGRLNLNDVGAIAAQDAAVAADVAAGASAPASAPAAPPAADPAPAALAAAAPSAPASGATPARRALPLNLVLGGVKLVNGNIDFTDRFIRPNYSALLSELNGRIGSFRSGAAEMAPLELTGRAAGTALLDVRGSINPTADPLALDIRAKATDLELAPLSPYAGKYAGYKIERGKLSMDVQYSIKPDGTLQANNQVILNQLTFGEKVDSPSATSLPVRLAVALLKDGDGVIDINLPISGSLNDPQFSLGRLILRVIVNLLVKVATSPFSLLAGGGGEESNTVEFVPGTATLTPPSGDVVKRVGQALTKRPNLILTVAGAADSDAERNAIAKANFDAMLRSEWRKQQLRAGKAADQAASAPENAAAGAAPEAMPKAERDRVIKEIYQDTKLPNKPRNLVGWPKDIPVPEMEALLMAAQPAVSADAARELALRRGIAVRDALIAHGLPSERLFLAAPKVGEAGSDAQAFKPKVELSLAPR